MNGLSSNLAYKVAIVAHIFHKKIQLFFNYMLLLRLFQKVGVVNRFTAPLNISASYSDNLINAPYVLPFTP